MNKPTAIVTGGARGLGYAIARALSDEGYNVVIFDIDEEALGKLEDLHFVKMTVDVTDETAVLTGTNEIIERFGSIEVLVNNAGTIYSEPLINIMNRDKPRHSLETFKRNIEVNLNSVFLVGSIVAEKMVQRRTRGVIVNISSICAIGNAGQSAYSAAKAGVEALTRVWSKELGVFGIRTVAIAPGFIDTESTNHALSEQRINDIRKNTPLRRLGSRENVAQAVMSVIRNDFINGAAIAVDGGIAL